MTEVAASEMDASRQPILSPEMMDMLSGAANHEAKLLMMLYLAMIHGLAGTQRPGIGFNNFLGPEANWKPSDNAASGYCSSSLDAIAGIIECRSSLSKRPAPSLYTFRRERIDMCIPGAALLLGWSLDNPDLSLQTILGGSRSRTKVRTPQQNMRVLLTLLNAGEIPLSISEIAINENMPSDTAAYHAAISLIDNAVTRLETNGLVTVERQIVDNQDAFEIVSGERPENRQAMIVRGIYAFVDQCRALGQVRFTMLECLDFIEGWAKSNGVEEDKASLRLHLNNQLVSCDDPEVWRALPGISRVEKFSDAGFTRVSIKDSVRPALASLADILLAIDGSDAEVIESGWQLAGRIIDNDGLKGRLIDKANRFSTGTNMQEFSETTSQIIEVLRIAEGPLSVSGLHRAYQVRFERRVALNTIRSAAQRMASRGLIELTEKPASDSRRRLLQYFSTKVVA